MPSEFPSSDGIYKVGRFISAPKLLVKTDLGYPQEQSQPFVEGAVRLEAVIGMDGVPDHIRVVQSLNANLDAAAVGNIKTWRFRPAYKQSLPQRVDSKAQRLSPTMEQDGEPVAVKAIFELHFAIPQESTGPRTLSAEVH